MGIFNTNSTRLLNIPIYAGVQFFIELFLAVTLTKLRHIKRNHHSVSQKNPP